MAWGILAAAAFLISAVKFLTKRLPCPKLDTAARKLHPFSSVALYLFAVIHPIVVWHLHVRLPAVVAVFGFLMLAGISVTLLSHIFAKKLGRHWLPLHRAASVEICVCLVFHVFFQASGICA
ncbi:MAG: hypothetical protein LKE53_01750 [Oscillospiraceae bacterium]|nr:hypothetical protein [Oscillospiraceae bacterium]MDD3261831.1 hypothetical protein [Oscillospiraceae bacterium]